MENALDRLLKESEHDNDDPRYSLEEQMEDEENEPSFLDAMSGQATDLLKSKIKEDDTLEDILNETEESSFEDVTDEVEINAEEEVLHDQEEPKEEVFNHIEKVTLDTPVVEQKKPQQQQVRGRKKMAKKDPNVSKADELMSNLANECIDIMIQSGVTIHNFSEEQMQIIWAYIREKLNANKN